MASSTIGGVVSISIDGQRIEPVIAALDCFAEHQIAATWALADPIATPLTARIGADFRKHEIALLATSTRANETLSRADFVRTIGRRLQAASTAGILVSTLAVAEAWQPRHVDLLLKYGVTMVRGEPATGDALQSIRYGLWHMPIAVTLRGGGWTANRSQLRLARRAIEMAATHHATCHLRVDLSADENGSVLRCLEQLLGNVSEQLQAGRIRTETLRDTAMRLRPKRLMPSAHSILRAA